MNSVREWLERIGLGQYAPLLQQNDVDLEVLKILTEEDLEHLGVSFGHRKKIFAALGKGTPSKPAAEFTARSAANEKAAPSVETVTAEGERRQVTVLFCDLVGSTALSNRLDPEPYRAIMSRYHESAIAAIQRFDGFVQQIQGDGIVAYFGYPIAHEQEADRAVRAGLAIVEALSTLDVGIGEALRVRIGVASGLVVVSHVLAPDKTAVGETPNLAQRMQTVAHPGEVMVSERTRALAGGGFDLEDRGLHQLKGIAEPARVWKVLRPSDAPSRFEAATSSGLTPMVGREQEIGLLLDRWELARAGDGQVVLLQGEPGIGKSRMLRAFRERLGTRIEMPLQYQCSPYYTNSALYPVIDHLERALGFAREDAVADKLDKLERHLLQSPPSLAGEGQGGGQGHTRTHCSLLARMLSIPCDERYGPLNVTPQRQKEDTLGVLVQIVATVAQNQPTAVLFEDVHWADPTTLEALDLLVDKTQSLPLLVLITFRPEFEAKWTASPHVSQVGLNRLSRVQSANLILRVAGGKPLPADLATQIVDKTDGVPLFLEELTKAVLESEIVIDRGDRYEYSGKVDRMAIPVTLRDSLMARLDRLFPVKELAQIGAVIGREFSHELIAAVSPIPEPQLTEGLDKLVASELIFRRGTPPDATYIFKHALVQDAAYDSLLKSKRQELHPQIAEAITRHFPARAEAEPELLAHHYTEGAVFEKAVGYWRLAAERASARFATTEAIAHGRRGLATVTHLSEGTERIEQELALRMGLIASLRMADRYDEALEELERAEALAAQNKRIVELARIHHLRGNIYFPLGKIDECLTEHQAALRFARQAYSTEDEARALGGLTDAYYMRGQMRSAHEHVERCIALCRAHGFVAIETAYLPMRAATHMYGLRFAEALEDSRSAVDMAVKVGQPRAEIVARSPSIVIHFHRDDFAQAEEHARRMLELVEKIGARRFLPLCNHTIARARLHAGDRVGALEILEASLAICRETGITFAGPSVLSAIAMASDDPKRREEALREAQAILDRGSVSHNYFWFYRDAIEISLAEDNWDRADAYVMALENYVRDEPIPWSDFIIARGRALAEFGRGSRRKSTLSEIQRLRDEATRLEMKSELARLEAALQLAGLT